MRQAEHARLGVARLRARRDGADLDEAEAQRGEAVDVGTVLVEARGQAYRIGEIDAHHGAFVGRRFAEQSGQAAGGGAFQRRQGQVVGRFGVE